MKKLLFALSLIVSAVHASAACSVQDLVAQHIQWLGASKSNVVRVTAVSNQKNRIASYATGDLKITGQSFPGTNAPTYLGGTLTQYFSDRTYALPSRSGISFATNPFSPTATDSLAISIASSGAIVLQLKSWNNTNLPLSQVSCAGDVLYGLTNTTPQSMYVISLSRDHINTAVIK